MGKFDFNEGWKCYAQGEDRDSVPVTLPHDAMLWDKRIPQCPGGTNTGWYDARDYIYEKNFYIPDKAHGQNIIFEFEGIYKDAIVFVNGKNIASHEYGYTGFFADATENIVFKEENEIRIEVKNSDQPNSRWYTGTGIYRPAWMHVLPEKYIFPDGIRVTTIDYEQGLISVEVKTNGCGRIRIQILDNSDGKCITECCSESKKINSSDGHTGICKTDLTISDRKLWTVEEPHLYLCRVTYGEDVQEVRFGIRTIQCSPENGFCINGDRVILKGACLHHDNGILGGCAYPFSEKRKVRILKENGYNAIRSAHNPCSKAMLDACDELGVLVVDEYADMWYIHKTKFDYGSRVMQNFREDIRAIVGKDYNHPSVIMYSTGNEVSETAQKKGIEFCRTLTDTFHELDATRPVTCGVNIFFNFLSSMGLGVYSDKKADQAAEDTSKKKAVGSEFYNTVAGLFGSEFMKIGATLYLCDLKTRDSFANMDVAGYNYGIKRYRHDLKKYPRRLILGTETFCSDAYTFWKMAKKEKRLIGDFVWSGVDYLGEVGIGAWEYKDYAPDFEHGPGWVTAGAGRIDLTGKPLAEMAYTRVAFGLERIAMGVIPVNHTGDRHSPSAWKMSNAIESWSWEGCEGKKAKIEIYARAVSVELFLNGKSLGRKKINKNLKTEYCVKYQPGELMAVAYDGLGEVVADKMLRSAGDMTQLTLCPENKKISRKSELCYLRLQYTDDEGEIKPLVKGEIVLTVKGGELLGFGSACPYYKKSYLDYIADTYYGEALAVIKPEKNSKKILIRADSPYGVAETEIVVEE